MKYSRTAVLVSAALSLTALASPPAAQAASTAASAYSYSAAPPKIHHARHRSTFVPGAATAQVPEVGDSSCYLDIYYSFAVNPAGHVHRLMTMCGPQ